MSVAKEEPKPQKRARDEFRPKWSAPAMPNLEFVFSERDLTDFLREGEVARLPGERASEEPEDSEA